MSLHDTFKIELPMLLNKKDGYDSYDIPTFMFIEVATGKSFIMPFPMDWRLNRFGGSGNVGSNTTRDFQIIGLHFYDVARNTSFPFRDRSGQGSVQQFGDV